MMSRGNARRLACAGLLMVAMAAGAEEVVAVDEAAGPSPQQQFETLLTQFRAAPSDDALRIQVIAFAQVLQPAPVVPDEARRLLDQGYATFASAVDAGGYAGAIRLFAQAADAAPWWGDAYDALSQAQEKAGDLAGARLSLQRLLASHPSDAAAAKARAGLQRLAQLAAQAANPPPVAVAAPAPAVTPVVLNGDAATVQRRAWAQQIVQSLAARYGTRVQTQLQGNGERGNYAAIRWYARVLANSNGDADLRIMNERLKFAVGGDGDRIEVTFPQFGTRACGTPSGPAVESVTWTYCGDEAYMKANPAMWLTFWPTSQDGRAVVEEVGNCVAGSGCYLNRYKLELP